ncbi:hypothetical protein CHH49_18135 [Terribacillus saccharophilus]|uniref:hypothetical protein n=1 Tax=Terribacillus saccharophilus TaxID=361277 RepID=UPI000BA662E0|nr:hypothetical protein [Terribacillus saccharophilus]PAF20066.1 hypothetical protein CHH49_18135 [Terribacillus saccharophilus]
MKFKLMMGMMIVLIVPFISTITAHAAVTYDDEFVQQGYLEQGNYYPGNAMFDGKLSTSKRIQFKSYEEYDVPNSPYIEKLYFKAGHPSGGTLTLQLYDEKGYLINIPSDFRDGLTDVKSRVSKLRINNTPSSFGYVYELALLTQDANYPVDPATLPPDDITDLKATVYADAADITMKQPGGYYSHYKVYRDGVLLSDNETKDTFSDEGLTPETTYKYKFVPVSEYGIEGNPAEIEVTTKKLVIEEVENLRASTDWDRVDLSWKLPESRYFDHVNIYRRTQGEEKTAFNLLVPMVVEAESEYEPLFETNGTYFNDLSVEPATKYEYKVTSEYQGKESDGLTVEAMTKGEPKPVMKGEDFSGEEGEPFTITWDEPTEGKVIVSVGGKEIGRAAAGDGSYTIPADQMEYDAFGNPRVSIQPVTDRGTMGDKVAAPTQFEKDLDLPFTVPDLIETGTGLLKMIGPFVLVGLAFLLVKLLIKLIKDKSLKGKGLQSEVPDTGRRIDGEKIDHKNVVPSSEKQERESEKQAKLLDKHQQKQQKELRKSQQKEQRQQEKAQRREKSVLRQSERQLARPIRETRQSRESRVSYREPRSQRAPRQGRTGRRDR